MRKSHLHLHLRCLTTTWLGLAWLRRSGVRAAAIHSGCRQIFKIDPSDHRRQLVRAQSLSQSVSQSGSQGVTWLHFTWIYAVIRASFFWFPFLLIHFLVFLIFAISFVRLRLSKIHRCGPQLGNRGQSQSRSGH